MFLLYYRIVAIYSPCPDFHPTLPFGICIFWVQKLLRCFPLKVHFSEFPGFHPHPNKKQEKNSTIFLRKKSHEKTHKTLAWIETSSAPQVKLPRFAGWIWPLDLLDVPFGVSLWKVPPVDAKVPISAEKNNKTNESRSQGVTNGHSIWHQAKITQTIHTIFWGNIPQILHRFAWMFLIPQKI